MTDPKSPLADEYANATESNLDQAKPEELEQTSHADLRPKEGAKQADDEHPLSVGKP